MISSNVLHNINTYYIFHIKSPLYIAYFLIIILLKVFLQLSRKISENELECKLNAEK